MPTELKGSPKQVSWAKIIRKDRLNIWKASAPDKFKEVEDVLNVETSASWWITHRKKEFEEVSKVIQQKGKSSTEKVKTAEKPAKEISKSTVSPSLNKESFTVLNDVHRIVGELRDAATGEVVIDTDCPF